MSHGNVPITSDMAFGIGSNTKTFAAITILKLAEAGVLSLNDPISQWIPNLASLTPHINPNITIRQILNHSSSISTYPFLDSVFVDPQRNWSPEELIRRVPPPPPAGSMPPYSNTNYVLAGMIIEAATGTSVSAQFHQKILSPLQLDSTFFPHEEPVQGTVANPWWYGNDISAVFDSSVTSMIYAAGCMFSTPSELVQLYQQLFNHRLLSPASMQEMLTLVPNLGFGNYGLGVSKFSWGPKVAYGHTGGYIGYRSIVVCDTGTHASMAIIFNQFPTPKAMKAYIGVFDQILHAHKVTVALAGEDQLPACDSVAHLQANVPPYGTGHWTVVSGTGGNFGSPNTAHTTFTGQLGQQYVLRWTVTRPGVSPAYDEVRVRFNYTVAKAGPNQLNLCDTTSTTLAGNNPGSNSGLWTILTGTGGQLANPAQHNTTFTGQKGQTYTLRWEVSNSYCSKKDHVMVRFLPVTLPPAAPDAYGCSNEPVLLTAHGGPNGQYRWYTSLTGPAPIPNQTDSTFSPGILTSDQVFYVSLMYGTCETSRVPLQVHINQAASAEAGEDQLNLCQVATTSLAALPPAHGSGSWSIVSGTGGMISNPTDPASAFTGQMGQTYVLRWNVSNPPCHDSSDLVRIKFATILDPPATIDSARCGSGPVTLRAKGAPNGLYSWYETPAGGTAIPGAVNKQFVTPEISQTQVYYVSHRTNLCESIRAPVTAYIYEAPNVKAGADQTIIEGTPVRLAATGAVTFSWSPAGSLANATTATPTAYPPVTTTYTVSTVTRDGCASADTVVVTVLPRVVIPNGFTPNNDGINDTWEIKFAEQYPDCTLDIFNRQGLRVYSQRGLYRPWDGTGFGRLLPPDTYYYVLTPRPGTDPIAGSVTLIR